jgi:hypothetical protein
MSSRVVAESGVGIFKRTTFRETAVLLAVAWLVPFMVHLIPWSGDRPLGALLLPMFWTGFVAVYLYGLRVGLLVGLFAPALNLVLTGLPALSRLAMMSFEIAVFVSFAWWLVQRKSAGFWVAPLGYLTAKLATALLQILTGASALAVGSEFPTSLVAALPGLVILAGVNYAVIKYYPKQGGGRLDDAAGV